MRLKEVWATAALSMALALSTPAAAAIIDFDDLTGDESLVANGYAGLQWDNFFSLDPFVDMPYSGYNNALVSGGNIAHSGYDSPATIAGLAGLRLDSAYFTAGFNDGMTVFARGYNGTDLLQTLDFIVTTTDPTRIDFGWSGLTHVIFSSSGGVDQMYDMSGTNFAIDDLEISESAITPAVPEPATWMSMLLGFGVVGAAIRHARRRVAMAG